MYIANIRVTHKNAPHDVIDRMILTEPEMYKFYEALLSHENIDEAVVVQTCNRFEFYFSGKEEAEGVAHARKFVLDRFGADIAEYLVVDSYLETLEHLFRVTSSIDSLIVGESQILAQVKEALSYASKNSFSVRILDPVFQKAISVGKRIRTETRISEGKVSISSAAVDLATQHAPIRDKKVVIIGTGRMASLLAEHIRGFGNRELVVVGRTPEKVTRFCETYSGRPASFSELPGELKDADFLFSATSCPRVLVAREMVEKAAKGRERPLTLVDIAMPSDMDPTVGELPNIQYLSIDDLKEISCKNMAARHDEVKKAEVIIGEELTRFKKKLQNLHIETFLSHLNMYTEEIRQREVEKALNMLGAAEPRTQDVIEDLSRSLVKRIMHNFLMGVRSSPTTDMDIERFVEIFMGNGNGFQRSNEKA